MPPTPISAPAWLSIISRRAWAARPRSSPRIRFAPGAPTGSFSKVIPKKQPERVGFDCALAYERAGASTYWGLSGLGWTLYIRRD
jgi:hypothetical protein